MQAIKPLKLTHSKLLYSAMKILCNIIITKVLWNRPNSLSNTELSVALVCHILTAYSKNQMQMAVINDKST